MTSDQESSIAAPNSIFCMYECMNDSCAPPNEYPIHALALALALTCSTPENNQKRSYRQEEQDSNPPGTRKSKKQIYPDKRKMIDVFLTPFTPRLVVNVV
jgi:hypothetical protein